MAASIYTSLKHDVGFIGFNDVNNQAFRVPVGCTVLELGPGLLKSLNATDYAGEQRDLMRVVREQTERRGGLSKIKVQKIDSIVGLKTALGAPDQKEGGQRPTNVALVTDDPAFENRAHIIYVSDSEDEQWGEMVKRASRRGNIRVYTYDPSRGVGRGDAFIALLQAL